MDAMAGAALAQRLARALGVLKRLRVLAKPVEARGEAAHRLGRREGILWSRMRSALKKGESDLGRVRKQVAADRTEQLRKLDAGCWKGSNWVGERIPTLDEVLDLLPESAFLFMEVKCGPEIIKPLTARLKARGVKPSQLVVISFNKEVIRKFKEFNPDFIAYLLTSFKTKKGDGTLIPTAKELITLLKDIQADGLDYNADSRLDPSFAKTLRKAGYSLHVWTVNDEAKARRFIKDFAVESITTDRPEWLRNKLD